MRRRSQIMLVALVLFVTFALMSCGQQDPQATSQEPKEPAAEPRGGSTTMAAAPEPVGMGETAEVGPFAVTLNAASQTTADGGPDEGGRRYAVVDLTLENRDEEAVDASDADYMLRDAEGYSFEPGDAPDQRPRPQGQVEPGAGSSGEVAFELGDQQADGRLELAVSLPNRPETRAAYFAFAAEKAKEESGPQTEPQPSPEPEAAQEVEDPAPTVRSGYSVVEDPSGSLSVEVPSSWSSQTGADSEGEGGENSWSPYAGEYLTTSITSARSLDAWYGVTTGGGEGSGVYMVASEALAQRYTDDELIYSLFYERKAATCVEGPSQNIDRPPYSGKVQAWFDCNGLDNASYIFTAAPEGRPCVVVGGARVAQGASEADREAVEHVVDSFEVDCGALPLAEPLDSSASASASAASEEEADQPEETAPQDSSPAPQSSGDLDCSDFDTQAEAQAVYEQDTSDPNGLDGPQGEGYTGDPGIACEELLEEPTTSPSSSAGPESPPPSSPEPGSPEPSSPEPGSAPPQGGDIDCDDVDGPIQTPPGDPNNLDGDGDGIACE